MMLNRFRTLLLRFASAYVRGRRDNVLDNYDVPRKPAELRFPVVALPLGLELDQRSKSAPTGTRTASSDVAMLRSIMIPPPAA